MAEFDAAFDAEDKPRMLALLEGDSLPSFPDSPTAVNDTDGRKILFSDGWIIVRFSGTEPRLRIFCEMPTQAQAEQYCHIMGSYLGMRL